MFIAEILLQIFISFFFKKMKPKKSNTENEPTVEEDDIAAEEEASLDAQVEQDDEGQIAHDEATVKSMRDQAIQIMAAQGVRMSAQEKSEALKLFPAVIFYFLQEYLLLIHFS